MKRLEEYSSQGEICDYLFGPSNLTHYSNDGELSFWA